MADGSPSTDTGTPADDTTGTAPTGVAETDDTVTDAAPPSAPDATDDVSVAPADVPDGVPADSETGQAPADESPDQTPAMPGFEGPTLGAMLDAIDQMFSETPPDAPPPAPEEDVLAPITVAFNEPAPAQQDFAQNSSRPADPGLPNDGIATVGTGLCAVTSVTNEQGITDGYFDPQALCSCDLNELTNNSVAAAVASAAEMGITLDPAALVGPFQADIESQAAQFRDCTPTS